MNLVARGGGGHASRDVDSRANEGAVVGQAGKGWDAFAGAGPFPASLREVRGTTAAAVGVAVDGQPSRPSSGGGGSQHQPVTPTDPFVDEHGHQVRERPVSCRGCRRPTWRFDARCEECA